MLTNPITSIKQALEPHPFIRRHILWVLAIIVGCACFIMSYAPFETFKDPAFWFGFVLFFALLIYTILRTIIYLCRYYPKRFAGGIAFLIAFNIGLDLFDNRPIKFETFKDDKEFSSFIREHYPKGSDADRLLEDAKNSGAECECVSKENYNDFVKRDNPPKFWRCYYHRWLSFDPLRDFRLYCYGDKRNSIVSLSTNINIFLIAP